MADDVAASKSLFPSGTGSEQGATLFPAFAAFPAFASAQGSAPDVAHSGGPSMETFSSFKASAPEASSGGLFPGGVAGDLLRSRDVMNDELCAGTFGHARLSDDEDDQRQRPGQAKPREPTHRDTSRNAPSGEVFRLELSSSDSEDGGAKRKKRDKKKSKDKKDRKDHKDRNRPKERDRGRGRQETEREREVREDREERERLQKRQKKDSQRIDEVNPHHKISLHDLWQKQKPGAVSSSAPVSASSVMFFDRYGDAGNYEYGHPFKLEIPAYRVDWFWCGRALDSSSNSKAGAGAGRARARAWNSTVIPELTAAGKRGSRGDGDGEGRACWRKRGGFRVSMLGIPRCREFVRAPDTLSLSPACVG